MKLTAREAVLKAAEICEGRITAGGRGSMVFYKDTEAKECAAAIRAFAETLDDEKAAANARIELLEGDLRIAKACWHAACHDIDQLQRGKEELHKTMIAAADQLKRGEWSSNTSGTWQLLVDAAMKGEG